MLTVSHLIVAIISPLIKKKTYEYTIHIRLMDGSHCMTMPCVYMYMLTHNSF